MSALRSAQQALTPYDLAALRTFALSIANPPDVRSRAVETIEPAARAFWQTVSAHFTITGSNSATGTVSPVAIMLPAKGELQDNLAITDEAGEGVATLTYYEYLALVMRTVRQLIVASDVSALHRPRLFTLEQSVMNVIRQHLNEATIPLVRQHLSRCLDEIDDLKQHCQSVDGQNQLQTLASFTEALAFNFAIVALIEGSGNRVVTYKRTVVPRMRVTPFSYKVVAYLRDRFRLLLGARPVDLYMKLSNASSAASYHLEVVGPEGMYVARQQVLGIEDELLRLRNLGSETPYYRLRRRLGQRYLHAYFRSVSPDVAQRCILRARFLEVPPGSIARAGVASVANFVLIFLAGTLLSVGSQKQLASDFPALILAFPAVAAAAVGFENLRSALFESTLASRLAVIATIFLSVAASGLYLAQSADLLQAPSPDFVLLTVRDWYWVGLTSASFFVSAFAIYKWFTNSHAFMALATRPVHRLAESGDPQFEGG